MVEQRDHAFGVRVHPVHGGVSRLVGHAVTRQVEQDHPVAGSSERGRDRTIEVAVEQKAVQIDENLRARTVHLVREADVAEPEFPVCDRRDRTQAVR